MYLLCVFTGMTALHVACMEGHVTAANQLAKASGADMMQLDGQERRCLEVAIEYGHLDVVQALMSLPSNIRPNVQAGLGSQMSTALHIACANRRYDIINFLVQERGASVTARDSRGRTPDKVVKDPMVTLLVTGRLGDIPSLGGSGASVPVVPPDHTRRESTGSSSMVGPAPWADASNDKAGPLNRSDSGSGGRKFVSKPYVPPTNPSFLPPKSAGASASPPVKSGAFLPTEKPVVKKLNIKDNWIKVSTDDEEPKVAQTAAEEMAAARASSAALDASKKEATVATAASPSTNDYIPDANFAENGDPVSSGSAPNTGLVIKKKHREPVPEDNDTAQLFQWAADDSKIPQLESSLGVTPNIKRNVQVIKDPDTGSSLLHVACNSGHLAIAQLLVEGVGADVNAVDNNGRSCLHCAVLNARVLIVRYLVKYCGAALDIRDAEGKTALDCANELDAADSNSEEISRIISKAAGKSAEKRTKIVLPVYSGK